jgi:hypothetical protein
MHAIFNMGITGMYNTIVEQNSDSNLGTSKDNVFEVLKAKISETEKIFEANQEKIQQLENENLALKKKFLEEKRDSLKEYAKLHKEADSIIEAGEKKIQTIKHQVSILTEENAKLEKYLEKLKSALSDATWKCDELLKDNAELRQENLILLKKSEAQNRKRAKLKEAIKKYQAQMAWMLEDNPQLGQETQNPPRIIATTPARFSPSAISSQAVFFPGVSQVVANSRSNSQVNPHDENRGGSDESLQSFQAQIGYDCLFPNARAWAMNPQEGGKDPDQFGSNVELRLSQGDTGNYYSSVYGDLICQPPTPTQNRTSSQCNSPMAYPPYPQPQPRFFPTRDPEAYQGVVREQYGRFYPNPNGLQF